MNPHANDNDDDTTGGQIIVAWNFNSVADKNGLANVFFLDQSSKSLSKKSGKYWGPRRNGWVGAVSGGQEQYRVGRSSVDCSTTEVKFSAYRKSSKMLFWLVGPKKN